MKFLFVGMLEHEGFAIFFKPSTGKKDNNQLYVALFINQIIVIAVGENCFVFSEEIYLCSIFLVSDTF